VVSERIQRRIERLLERADEAISVFDWTTVRESALAVLALDPSNVDAKAFLRAAEERLAATAAAGRMPAPPVASPLPEGEGQGEGQPEHQHHPEQPLAGAGESPALPGPAVAPSVGARFIEPAAQTPFVPSAFANGRYTVKRFLGEGGKKQVYLAHDTLLDRDVAFALIKTEGLDDTGRDRITREAQAMGRLGTHPHIVSVFDLDEEPATGSLPILGEGAVGAGFKPARPTQPYIVTELMGGGDDEELIKKAPEHRPPLERTLEVGIEVCRGLEFAHSHGIVHRDLKPGNVWLTGATGNGQPATVAGTAAGSLLPDAAAVAKIGDFGLAVALDRSRLTQAGMMVGTVAYMPPEQAMGGEVTPQSDLYSLGAMLYEMVTGRPPFVGDESVAIITQHLNTAPVSPSWHNPAVPSGLEALILRLLEKDPAKRPAGAGEVGQALEGVRAGLKPVPKGAAHPSLPASLPLRERGDGIAAPPDSPMYGRTFVGREAELQQLQSAFDAATSGQGSLAMVVGEPGIGKTSLCEQLATYATIRGGKTLVGHCYEEGSLSLPYLPFVEAMRSYVLMREPDKLRQDLGTGAGDIARIVSEVRDRITDLTPGGSGWGSPSPLRKGLLKVTAPAPSPRPFRTERAGVRETPGHQQTPEPRSRPHPGPLPILGEGERGDPEEERYRLYQAVTGFLRNAAAVRPLVIVLEDLHDADRGTLDLLLHLSRNLAGSRLLLVGTYRDIEVDRSHPLSATLAELRRTSGFRRVLLRGLTADEVQRMLSGLSGQDVRWELAEAVHRQTEGNPLFVQEVLRYLVEEGLITREGGHWRASGDTPLAVSIPEGLRDVIGKRLSRLSPDCNRLLAIAAVIGRDFRLDTLQAVAGVAEESLLAALEEATRAAVLSEQARVGGVEYRFAHAFFRQTLYEELSVPRRLRMHQEVARVLERQYGNRLDEHAAELAEHFAQSTDPDDLRKAIDYAERAAHRALAVYAYGEAARHLEQALDVQEVLDPDEKAKRCDLLLTLAEALLPAGEPGRVFETVAPQAFALAEALDDSGRASGACQLALEGHQRYGNVTSAGTAGYGLWAERADRYAAPGTLHRVRADVAMARAYRAQGKLVEASDLEKTALDMAQQLGDPDAIFSAAIQVGNSLWMTATNQVSLERALHGAEELIGSPRAGVSARTLGAALQYSGYVFLNLGYRTQVQAAWGELADLARRTADADNLAHSLTNQIDQALLDGDLEAAAAAATRVRDRGEEFGAPITGWLFASRGFRPLLYLNRAKEALEAVTETGPLAGDAAEQGFAGWLIRSRRTLVLACVGRLDEARAAMTRLLAEQRAASEDHLSTPNMGVPLLETAVVLRDREAAALLFRRLQPVSSLAYGGISLTCVARHLGDAAVLLGERDEALAYYAQALEICEKIRFRPEIALTYLEIAELLLEGDAGGMNRAPTAADGAGAREGPHPGPLPRGGGDAKRAEALGHLDFAITEFRQMKMQPALKRALRHKEVLKA